MAKAIPSLLSADNGEGLRPIWTMLGLYGLIAVATSGLAIVWHFGFIVAGVEFYFLLTLLQFFGVALLGVTVWRRWDSCTRLAQAVFVSGLASLGWWSLAQPFFTTLVILFDYTQLTMFAVAWISLVPIWGVIMSSAFTFAVFRPFLYLKKPAKLYAYSTIYPRIMAIGFFVLVTAAYAVGPALIRVFANHPALEFYKFLGLGMVSVLFISIAFFFAHDTLVRSIRREAQAKMAKAPPVQQVYAWRVFISSILISLGILLFVGTVIFRLYQDIVAENVSVVLSERLGQAHAELISNADARPIDQAETLKLSANAMVIENPGPEITQQFSPGVVTALAFGDRVARNFQMEEAVVGILRDPAQEEAVLVVVPVRDFYTLLSSGLPIYLSASALVLIFSVAISGYFSFTLAHTLRALSSAVRRARDTVKPFTFSTYTGDELEELSRAFQYYITQANELRGHLEDKVKQRTQELIEVEKEKRSLEVAAAKQQTKLEHQRRTSAEEVAEQLEVKVQERTAALRDALAHLQELDRVKTEFISLASHQLRTPLTSLRWAQHALLEGSAGKLTDEQGEIVKTTLDRTMFMMGLVNELLDVTRIEDQQYELKRTAMPIRELLEGIMQDVAEAAEHKQLNLQLEAAKTLPTLKIDVTKMKMALSNVVDNAVKYTPAKGTVTVTASATDKSVEIQVADTGIGIPKKDAYRTFSKFFRASNATEMHTSGSGLGLYIAKTIVERHGGTIGLASEPGVGTTVTITIPIQQPEPEVKAADADQKKRAGKLGAIGSLVEPDDGEA